MCCGDKCLFFINVRTGSLIFGYISAIISGMGTIACTITAMIFGVRMMFPYDRTYYYPDTCKQLAFLAANIIIVMGFLIEFLSGFICSVLLLVGITKNKLTFAKTYIIYGMIQIVLLFAFFIILACSTNFFLFGYVLVAAAVLGIYALCLYMIYLTFKQPIAAGIVFLNPQANAPLN